MTRRRSPLFVLLLALLLAFAQQQAASHALEHDLEHVRGAAKSAGPSHDVCAKCLVFAHLDHASDVALPVVGPVGPAPMSDRPRRVAAPAIASIVRYDPRAPPISS